MIIVLGGKINPTARAILLPRTVFFKKGLTNPDDCDSMSLDYCNRLEDMMKLFDSELRLMELVWAHEPVAAKQVAQLAAEHFGWNKNTTYTVLKKLAAKGAISRSDPGFVCTSLVTKASVHQDMTDSLIDKLYNGSKQAFFAAFLQNERLSADELAELREMIERHEQ